MSDAEFQTAESQTAPSPSLSRPSGKPSNTSLIVLAVLFALSGLSVVVVPKVLQEAYYQEEESKREKNAVIVGTRTDTKPPSGSSNPYAGMPGQQSRNPDPGGNDSGAEKAADTPAK